MPQTLQVRSSLERITSAPASITDNVLSTFSRSSDASDKQSFASSTMHFLRSGLANLIKRLPGKIDSRLNCAFSKYQRRRIGRPETIDHNTLPREKTSNAGEISSTRIPIAHAGIQSRLPTFSKVFESR